MGFFDRRHQDELRKRARFADDAEASYVRSGNRDALAAAIGAYEEMFRDPAFGKSSAGFRLEMFNNAGIVYHRRFSAMRAAEDLHRAIALWKQAVVGTGRDDPDLASRLNNLAIGLKDRFVEQREFSDLQQAIEYADQAVALTPPASRHLASRLTNLGSWLRMRFLERGADVDLDNAVKTCERALESSAPGSDEWAACLQNVGAALSARHEHRGRTEDLGRAVEAFETASRATSPKSPELPKRLKGWGVALISRYKRGGAMADLELGIRVLEHAVKAADAGSTTLPDALSALASGLVTLYRQKGKLDDLDRAATLSRRAAGETAESSSDLPGLLNELSITIRELYQVTGDLGAMDEAVEASKRAAALAPTGSPSLAAFLNGLGNGLRDRHIRTGSIADLEAAIDAYEKAAAKCPQQSPALAGYLTNLASVLRQRSSGTDSISDLDRAIALHRTSLAATPRDSPEFPSRLNNLANGLLARCRLSGDDVNLVEAIQIYQEVVDRTPADAAPLPGRLCNLGNALMARYRKTKDLRDLERAVEIYQEAIRRAAPNSPQMPNYLSGLAGGLRAKWERTGHARDLEAAVGTYREAVVRARDFAAEQGFTSALGWADWAFERGAWAEASEAYGHALLASDKLVEVQLVRHGKETWLRQVQGAPARAAYAMARIGDVPAAVAVLEHGRGRLLAESLERDRADLEQLRVARPDVYQEYRESAERLGQLEARSFTELITSGSGAVEDVREARKNLGRALERIRALPGYETFLKPATWNDIRAAVVAVGNDSGAVYLATTSAGSIAAIVTSHEPIVAWLDFTSADLQEALVSRSEGGEVCGYLSAQLGRTADLSAALGRLFDALGQPFIAPLAAALRAAKIQNIMLIPAGRLALLPLHAALYDFAGAPANLIDEFTVTYIPNVRTLVVAHRELARRQRSSVLVGIGNPLPHPRPLRAAQAELAQIADLFPPAASRVLCGEAATRAAVLENFPHGTHLHFACHGVFTIEDPLEARLDLAGQEALTLRDILSGAARPISARLAVLSACQSAVSEFRALPDEFIGLPAGLLQAGVPAVVGTLWPVHDLCTAILMVKFYELHLEKMKAGNGGRPFASAESLRSAQQWLRRVTAAELTQYLSTHPHLDRLGRETLDRDAGSGYLHRNADSSVTGPEARPFADWPDHWASFIHCGV